LIHSGAWTLAEQLAHRACASTQYFEQHHTGQAFASMGDIRLRKGDLAGAEEAYTKAESLTGMRPLPGVARLELLRGHPVEAATLINAALAGDGCDSLARTQLLPDQVTIALAVKDLDTARAAAIELAAAAQTFGSKTILAAAEAARGAVALATDEDCPLLPLRRSAELWHEVGSPYECAQTRLLLAAALDWTGQPDTARLERAIAHASFIRLGAHLDALAAAEPATTT
jgi:hypothetical protein